MRLIERTNRFRELLVGILLLILSAYYVNSTMFFHRHTVGGDAVYHSHFFSKLHTTSSEDGGHTIEVVKLIASLNNIAIEQQNFDSPLFDVVRPLECVAQVRECVKPALIPLCYFSLRGPPRCI